MRRVEVLLPPTRLDEISDALAAICVENVTCSDVSVVVPPSRQCEVYRGSLYVVDFEPKVKTELLVQDEVVPRVFEILRRTLGIAEADEARVLLSEVVEVARVRAGGPGEEALDRAGPSLYSARP